MDRVPHPNIPAAADAAAQPRGQGWLLALALGLVALVGIADYLTGYDFDIYPFYSVPILLAACLAGRSTAILVTLLSTLTWWVADAASGHVYRYDWLRGWSLLVRMMFFCLALLAGRMFKQYRDAARARMTLLEKSRQLESEIIGVSENERQRLGRDIHDGLCQYLAAISFTADLLRGDLDREGHRHGATAGEIMDLLQDAVSRAREMARGLSPVDPDEGGLEAALEDLAASTSHLTGVACSFLCPGPASVRDNALAVHLFRIAQEAINNAIRHGRARTIIIVLEANGDELVLRVSDDGVGFDPARNGNGRGGMGLNTMRYRSEAAGGTLEIYPHAPSGTVVTCTINHDDEYQGKSRGRR